MIKWRSGLAGFVGASKQWIKGAFSLSYTVTTENVVTEFNGVSVLSRINDKPTSISSLMDNSLGIKTNISNSLGLSNWIDARGQSIISAIDETGTSVRSDV